MFLETYLFYILIILAIVLLGACSQFAPSKRESFTTTTTAAADTTKFNFALQNNNDEFYAKTHCTIAPDMRQIIDDLIETRQFGSAVVASILEIQCGTGCFLRTLQNKIGQPSWEFVGVDTRSTLINEANTNSRNKTNTNTDTNIRWVCDSYAKSMLFEAETFTHIFWVAPNDVFLQSDLNMWRVFANCSMWLQHGGKLYVQTKKFEKKSPTYESTVNTNLSIWTEYLPIERRQYEHNLFLRSTESIVESARLCGFHVKGVMINSSVFMFAI